MVIQLQWLIYDLKNKNFSPYFSFLRGSFLTISWVEDRGFVEFYKMVYQGVQRNLGNQMALLLVHFQLQWSVNVNTVPSTRSFLWGLADAV